MNLHKPKIKRSAAVLLSVALIWSSISVGISASASGDNIFNSGSGTTDAPYVIADVQHLSAFRDSVNAGQTYANQYIVLGSDIDVSGNGWTPIDGFAGTLNGKEHVINGVTIGSADTASNAAAAGFFATLAATAKVENLGINNESIFAKNGTALTYAGGLAAKTANGSTSGGTLIDNCYVTGSKIYAESTGGKLSYAGGLTAFLGSYGTVTNSWTNISVESKTGGTVSAYAGGLISMTSNSTVIANSYTLGDVTATSPNLNSGSVVGGLFGMQSGKSYNLYSLSKVTANNVKADGSYQSTSYTLVGALAGQVTANGSLNTALYNTGAAITVNGQQKSPVPVVGKGSANTDPTDVTGYTFEQLKSDTAVATLNNGLQSSGITLPTGITLRKWQLVNGTVTFGSDSNSGGNVNSGIFESGEGTVAKPYLIKTEKQLRDFAVSLNSTTDYQGQYVQLVNDIDVSSAEWNPVGQGEYAFRGTFDGNGHTINGIKYGSADAFKDSTDYNFVALFGVVGENGLIKNLGVTNVAIYTKSEKSINSAAIAGYLEKGGIDNSYATGTVQSKDTTDGNNFVGGLVSNQMYGYIINSWSNVNVRSETSGANASLAGGLVALNNRGLIANDYTLGKASGTASTSQEGTDYVSNLAATQAGAMVNCYVLGDISSDIHTFTLGSLSGMTTGIGRGYFSYYNTDANEKIEDKAPNPFVAVGTTVSMSGDDNNPDSGIISSGFNNNLVGYNLKYLKSDAFASVLNTNFAAFPADLSQWLPNGITLKLWKYDSAKDLVVPTGTDASVTYKAVTIPKNNASYIAGSYYGRSTGSNKVIVRATVTNDSITGITVVSSNAGTAFDVSDLINAVIKNQSTQIDYDKTNALKSETIEAIYKALAKAKNGDKTGYGTTAPSAVFAGGSGTSTDPYQIATTQQLAAFTSSINADTDYKNIYIKLTADLDLSGINWVPTGGGNGSYAFSGIFDGDGHTIQNLTIGSASSPASYQFAGLFGYANHAVFRNINLTNAAVNNSYSGTERSYTGALIGAGENVTDIDGVSTQGTVNSHSVYQNYVGGLIGYISGNDGAESFIVNSSSDVDVSGKSDYNWIYIGGITGINGRTYIINSYSLGDVTGDSGYNMNKEGAGGITGWQAGYVRNCYSFGNVKTVLFSTDVGGFSGRQTGIASTYYAYYNADAARYSGDTVLDSTKGVGVYNPSSATGQVLAQHVESQAQSFLKSAEFAALLNKNLSDTNVSGVLPKDTKLKTWIYDSQSGFVVLSKAADTDSSHNGTTTGDTANTNPQETTAISDSGISNIVASPNTGESANLLSAAVVIVISVFICVTLKKHKKYIHL